MFDAEQQKRLHRLLAGDRVAHAFLITGPGGAPFAEQLAAGLVCQGEEKPCGSCPHCKKAALHLHPDIITLAPAEEKKEIMVDQIRQLRADAYIRPNEAARKVYLIRPASAMNDNAQNALLKVLEEGPPYAAFLLVSETAGALLPTVRSRCEELFLFQETEQVRMEQAEELARLLLARREDALLRYCVELEKLSRDEWKQLLTGTVSALEEKVRENVNEAGNILPMIETLHGLWNAAQYNVGVGHLAGWLCAAVFP